jgi:hypothetical protein
MQVLIPMDHSSNWRGRVSTVMPLVVPSAIRNPYFRRAVEGLWEAAERWADAELSTETTEEGAERAERGGSGTSSPRRSRPSSSR